MSAVRNTAILWVLACAAAIQSAHAQPVGVQRTDLQRHDLSLPGWETVQARVDIDPGKVAPSHRHPGEEIIYVLEGTLEYRLQGQPPRTLGQGDVLFVPAGVIHSAKNIGSRNAAELGTYVVPKGKPLVEVVADGASP
ncbi:cupin domain-containing protein [Dyella humicola]|uniref:cupin domain-containing protein n=1 Tax=Dyella humicola TaxID=2992126 RepID=UPI00225C407F|nr:cupin domain-containing protein [Dyella humicola]